MQDADNKKIIKDATDKDIQEKQEQAKVDAYLRFNDNEIKKGIIINVNDMLNYNGEIDNVALIDETILEIPNMLLTEVNTDKPIEDSITNVRRDKIYWDLYITGYIGDLKKIAKQDISNVSKEELKELIVSFNKKFLTQYMAQIKPNAIDLMDNVSLNTYAGHLANAVIDLQIENIEHIGIYEFLIKDIRELIKDNKLTPYMDADQLSAVQLQLKPIIEQMRKDAKVSTKDLKEFLETFNDKDLEDLYKVLRVQLYTHQILRSIENVEHIRSKDIVYYENRHKQIETIDKLTNRIAKKYKKRQEELEKLDTPNDIVSDTADILNEMQTQNKKLEKTNYNTTLLSNKVFTNKDYEVDKPYLVPIENKKTKELTNTYITLYKEGANSITLSKNHKSINDAVGTLIDAGYKYITTKQLYNFINKGIVSNDYVPQENLDALLKDMLTMDTKAEIDATEQFNLKGYSKYLEEYEQRTGKKAKPVLMQSLLNFKILKNIPLPNGETTDIIQFMDYPAVYEYAKQFKQIAIVPAEIKNIGYNPKHSNKAVQITGLTSVIRDELIRQIEIRKSGINLDIVINTFLANECLFYDVVDKDNTNKVINADKRKDRCKKIELILDTFKDKGYIKGYKINPKGNVKKYSISITL